MELEEWFIGIEKIFAVVEVPEQKKVNIGTFYLARELIFGGILLTISDKKANSLGKISREAKGQILPNYDTATKRKGVHGVKDD